MRAAGVIGAGSHAVARGRPALVVASRGASAKKTTASRPEDVVASALEASGQTPSYAGVLAAALGTVPRSYAAKGPDGRLEVCRCAPRIDAAASDFEQPGGGRAGAHARCASGMLHGGRAARAAR